MAGQRSSSSFSFTYDVFLSFHVEDTRFGFTGHLSNALDYSGISTFMDDKELRRGGEITPALVKAIEESRIAIIVLSKNYAASSHCLEELASILDQRDRNHLLVFPVFYDVDPSHVRHQRGTYGEALAKHEEKSKDSNQKVQKWRNALRQVADLSGLHYRHGDGHEFRLIEMIVREVSRKINRTILHVADYPVGLESRLKEVQVLLELESNGESNGALMVGIHGVGGIGKTTLAGAIYNMIAHRFEAACFLSVRENSNINGLVHLQNMLLFEMIGSKDIHLRNSNEGALIIKHWLHRKKVLLILDDVNTIEQLEALVGGSNWFGPGSRVIITTRDRHLLAFHRVERTYEVQVLNHQDSLELLSHQVFIQGNFDPRHTEILNELVSYASGLPLALKVIGSYLFGKSVDEWTNALHRFKRIPSEEIHATLKTSFDALREDEQSVFLDIACCFKGYKTEKALDVLRAHHGYNVKFHIEVLIDKSLVSISSDDKVTLHPLVEDMGKEIVRQESLQEPGKRSRLWFPEDIVQVLKNNTGTSNIEIIHLDSPLIEEAIKWDGEAFKKMKNLRTLIIRRCHFSEAPKYLPNSLRVLEWWIYPSQKLPSDFNPEQLVIHNLPNMGAMSVILAGLTETSPSYPEVLQISISDPEVFQTSLQRVYEDDKTWRNVGLLSSVVGLLCFALSPSFNRLIRGWNSLKFFLYGVLSLVIFTTIFFAKKSSPSKQRVPQKLIGFAVLMFIAVYTFYYDKAVNGKPDILGLVSNAAFALVTLSLSRLIKFGHEMGIFSFFLSCLVVQLWTINWKLIFVAIVFGCPLFIMHSSSDSGHSSSDS